MLLWLLLLSMGFTDVRASGCEFASAPAAVTTGINASVQYWIEEQPVVLWLSEEKPRSRAYQNYLGDVSARVDSSPHSLLLRQRGFFHAMGRQDELRLFEKALSGGFGAVRKTGCLESLLLAHHLERNPNRESEFAAFVLRIPAADMTKPRIKIYFISGQGLSAVLPEEVQNLIKLDADLGAKLWVAIHNHPFLFSNAPYDIGGTMIPSIEDLDSYKFWRQAFGLKEFWITNGFHTLQVNPPF